MGRQFIRICEQSDLLKIRFDAVARTNGVSKAANALRNASMDRGIGDMQVFFRKPLRAGVRQPRWRACVRVAEMGPA
jgi:hypothetical protein